MDIDTNRIRSLLDKRDDIDRELSEALGQKKTITCFHCSRAGHTARSCPQKNLQA
jgi:hypothetical protein